MASAAAAGIKAFGLDRGLPFPLEDIPETDVILLVGGNPAETLPVMMQYFEEQQRRGGRLIVVDPRRHPDRRDGDAASAAHAGHRRARLPTACSTSRSTKGLLDRDFIEARTTGFDAVRRAVASYWPDRVERITGVPAKAIEDAARMLGTPRPR